jgi:hypothetical protein
MILKNLTEVDAGLLPAPNSAGAVSPDRSKRTTDSRWRDSAPLR